jgi:glucuronoarabinoxylan endo-1,4-beta-xylanase
MRAFRTGHRIGPLITALALTFVLVFIVNAAFPTSKAYAASGVAINGDTRYQTIDGFGFSEAFGRAASMNAASPDLQKKMLDLLFSTSDGAGFTIVRNIINSTSASIEPNSPGSPSAAPTYVWDGSDSSQVWLSQQAMKYGVHQIYADAWSAPGYMKTSGTEFNGGTLCGVPGATCSTGDWRQAYANYLVKYIQLYQSAGVPLSNVGFDNEPNLAVSYSSMVMSSAQLADFVKVLGPALEKARLHTKLTCCEAEGWDLAPSDTNAIMSDPLARRYTDVISSHGYTAPPVSPLAADSKHVWQTEWANFDTFDPAWDDGTAAAGFTWAQRIYTGLSSANLSAFLHWWGVNTSNTNSGLLHLNTSTGTIEESSRFWAFANYSRFIRPGAVRIGATSGNANLDTTAFRNIDGSTTIVVLNTGTSDVSTSFALHHARGEFAVPYLTNASNNLAQQKPLRIHGATFSATVPARSLVTYQIAATEHR